MVKTEYLSVKMLNSTDRKTDTIYLELNNEIEKYDGVESLSGIRSDGTRVIIGHKKIASKLKMDNPKIISIHCQNYRLTLAMLPFFKLSTFLLKNNNHLMC